MTVRLRHVAAINPPTPEFELLPDTVELPFLPLEAVWPGDRLDTTCRQPKAAVSSGYTRFREGDILLPKITPTFQADRTVIAIGLEGGVGAGTTELHVVRAGPDADVRYLRYLLSAKNFLDEGEASMIGVAGQKRVPDDCLRNLPVPVVDLRRQRAIADYLDRESARIDALIERKRRMVELVEMRFWNTFANEVLQLDAPMTPLTRAVTFLTDGPFGSAFTSRDYSESGAAVVRLGNIGFAEYRPAEQAFIPLRMYRSFLRHQVKPGDLLIAGLGDLFNHPGRACVAPELGPAIVKGKCFCARIDNKMATPEYLALLLSSPYGAQAVGASGRGSTRTMINLDIIKETILPLPGVDEQARVVQAANCNRSRTRALVVALADQISRLGEHRQALITAAVTGELEIPEAAA